MTVPNERAPMSVAGDTADRQHGGHFVAPELSTPTHGLHDHDLHDHDHSRHLASARRSALVVALVLNVGFFGLEIAGGVLLHSLALLADGVHMLSDVVALTIALGAASLASRPATGRHTFGLGRAEVLAALGNAAILLAATGWIGFVGAQRLIADSSTTAVDGGGVAIVAAIGLIINVASAIVLARSARGNLNMRGAYVHMATDALGSGAALVAGIGIVVWSAQWLDPIASIGVGAVTLVAGWRVLRDATHVLLDAAPQHLDTETVNAAILNIAQVTAVHHVHIWTIASDQSALSAHVVLAEELSLHDAQFVGAEIKAQLAHQFDITHTTLELECHDCGILSSADHPHDQIVQDHAAHLVLPSMENQ